MGTRTTGRVTDGSTDRSEQRSAAGEAGAGKGGRGGIPELSVRDTARVVSRVILPTVGKGVILRRPSMEGLAERWNLDRRAVREVQRISGRYGRGPVMLRIPLRRQALVLEPEDVHRVLAETPEPFSTASMEKRGALGHFEPKGALVSRGADRAERRRFNESVLENDCPMHRLAESFAAVVRREAGEMLAGVPQGAVLDWGAFSGAWFRVVRQVVFGAGAREDHELRELLDTLRSHGNWSFLHPGSKRTREAFFRKLNLHLSRAEEGSLAAVIAAYPKTERTAADHQVPQWLFAFDPAGMTAFRSLALLAAHPEHAERAREEAASGSAGLSPLPMLRAAALEALRLWPTTPLVLRETTRETAFATGTVPAGTGIILFAPYFHRDDRRLPFADRFAPEVWLEGGGGRMSGDRGAMWERAAPREEGWPLIPFSGGPAVCPGRHVVLLTVSAMVAEVLMARRVRLAEPERVDRGRAMPGILDHFSLRFVLE